MFDSLADRLQSVFKKIRGHGRLDEKNIQEGLREVRLALLEADVNFKVVKDFVERVRVRATGQDVLGSLTPGQQVVKIVHDEMVDLLGGEHLGLQLHGKPPAIIMLVGLQGSGKTTTAAKLALHLRRMKRSPYLVPADVYRPAAIDQLHKLATQLDVPAFASTTQMRPVDICVQAREKAEQLGHDVLLLDTAGRLHIDTLLMEELSAIKQACAPQEILFVADAMTGQDAVNVAVKFDEILEVTGIVLTKMEGDARGGAALSIKSVTGKPIKFVGMGEKVSDLEVFHPDRVASRILGMGDILSLIEKAQGSINQQEAEDLEKKLRKAEFNLEDFRTHMRRLRKLGSLEGMLKLIPGMGDLRKRMGEMKVPEKEMSRMEAIINSMTPAERQAPKLMNASRKIRVANGSGVKVQDVNLLLKNFEQMQKMMKKVMTAGPGALRAPAGPSLPAVMPRKKKERRKKKRR
jgi:signal recognition particle subunit SRP54